MSAGLRARWEQDRDRRLSQVHDEITACWKTLRETDPDSDLAWDTEKRLNELEGEYQEIKRETYEEAKADNNFDEVKARRKGEF